MEPLPWPDTITVPCQPETFAHREASTAWANEFTEISPVADASKTRSLKHCSVVRLACRREVGVRRTFEGKEHRWARGENISTSRIMMCSRFYGSRWKLSTRVS